MNSLATTTSTINVPFNGDNLYLVNFNGQPYVPMRPIVEGMGLSWGAQFVKIKQRFNSTISEIEMVAQDGKKREMTCLALRKLAGWLHTINVGKVRLELREKVARYQEECDDVLYEYWTTGQVTRKTDKSAKTTVDERTPLRDAVNLLVSKKHIMYPEAYAMVHHRFNVESIEHLTSEQIPQAIEYIHRIALEGEFLGKEDESPAKNTGKRRYYVKVTIFDSLMDSSIEAEGKSDSLRDIAFGFASDLGFRPNTFTCIPFNKSRFVKLH